MPGSELESSSKYWTPGPQIQGAVDGNSAEVAGF
jgi:hypothetical protein